ncbi:hypothetical protein AAGQ96_10560 [Pantoea sp. MBD-2R]|uniref:hypothetical protein n=1 Tax=Pantoea sp. MBD-2R TaxID=3141540 RepID=UPI0031836BE2
MFINPFLLSEPALYEYLGTVLPEVLSEGKPLNLKKIKKIAYASWHRRHFKYSDQVFHGHWENLENRKKEENSLSRALLAQVARFHLDADLRRISVRQDRFDQWQGWLANQSGLPVIAYQAEEMDESLRTPFDRLAWLKKLLGFRTLIAPYHPRVEDYIQQQGLHESHMHLNGTTSLELMWHFSLLFPNAIVKDLQEKWIADRVQLLYAATPVFDHPTKYERLLNIARNLRELLLTWIAHPEQCLQKQKDSVCRALRNDNFYDTAVSAFPLESSHFTGEWQWSHIEEIHFHVDVLRLLKKSGSDKMDACYLLYILCMNSFQRVLVQRDDQYGFDQFQKFADDGIRESYEKDYTARFYQLHGPSCFGRPDLVTLEGRFAPKSTHDKNEELIGSILKGFINYAQGKEYHAYHGDLNDLARDIGEFVRPTLRLVAHFIKKSWDNKKESHFYTLRNELHNSSLLLFNLFEKHPNLRKIITGVDAAANELEAPPEVFSVLYRNCRRQGIKNFTYHVGEDFEHLLSGIRAVYEAVTLLDLKNGDRLGHATAIGIDPHLWLSQVPEVLYLKQGQWLENLLFIRQIALEDANNDFPLPHIEAEINKISETIFERSVSLDILQKFFLARDLYPDIVQDFILNTSTGYIGWQRDELKRAKEVDKHALEYLCSRWFKEDVIARYELKKEFKINFFSAKVLIKAQQYVQSLVAKRQVVIETLPTSNVRISHYSSISEHHIFRWMQVPCRSFEGDSAMLIAMGSDDPGIFVTDMRNEFYHLFSTLINTFHYDDERALRMVARINENGRIYRFDHDESVALNEIKKGLAEKRSGNG